MCMKICKYLLHWCLKILMAVLTLRQFYILSLWWTMHLQGRLKFAGLQKPVCFFYRWWRINNLRWRLLSQNLTTLWWFSASLQFCHKIYLNRHGRNKRRNGGGECHHMGNSSVVRTPFFATNDVDMVGCFQSFPFN